ncbi:AMP-dependent synthetase [Marmoricola sp. Leaf446]|uniref:AMP-binding protein n=1 Tax=Marmoricola sp. Leaf446 TaxID=1736379 RepID=UPI0006FE0D02|nr:AMP-binding protein [Marmoricola sp. Leaf446]KQT91118.1 AMP-dependent synthetase [Marmoricola sp. Leaf446]
MTTSATDLYRDARDRLLGWGGRYEEAVEQFRYPEITGPFNWVHDWFDVVAEGNDARALVVVQEDGSSAAHTFAELLDRSRRLASWLHGLGVRRGDAVIVMLGNRVELWEAMLAVMRLGAVVMPTTTAVGPADLTDRIERGEVRHVVVDAAAVATFDGVPGDWTRISVGAAEGWHTFADGYAADPADPVALDHPGTQAKDRLLLYFTSGTTSRPKLVEHTQVSYPVGHLSTMYWLGVRPGDVHLNISSAGWAKHAWSCFFAPWIAEATIVVLDYARFEPASLLARLREQRVTTFCAPPTVWRMLIKSDLAGGPGQLRELIGAGEPLNPEVIAQVQEQWGMTLRDGYGQTEMTAAVGNTPGAEVRPGSMGRPLPGVPVVLVDPLTGEPSATEGEICLDLDGPQGRPLPLMTGYQGDPARDAEAMAGGYYHTGDLATRDADGYITYVGRTDDVFKASDYKVSPFELESVLIEHPAVAEAAVVPAPDALRLAVPKAYVTLVAGHEPTRETALSILAHARDQLPPYLRVRRVEFAELPKTVSGKIRRVELRGLEDEAAAGEARAGEWRYEDFEELRTTR